MSDVPAVDVPAVGVPAVGVPAVGVPAVGVPAVGVPAADVPAVDVVVIGAGLAGLAAAGRLGAGGVAVTLVEASGRVGGRLATVSVGAGTADAGAQFFTARSRPFGDLTASWLERDVAVEWCRGFGHPADGHPRYVGRGGMVALAEDLAARLPDHVALRTGAEVISVAPFATGRSGDLWSVVLAGASTLSARAVVVTGPGPAADRLLPAGLSVPVRYEPTVAAMFVLDGPSGVPAPGGVQLHEGPFSWVADNLRKGVSPIPVVTMHATGAWSRQQAGRDDGRVLESARQAGAHWLGSSGVVDARLIRWPEARPVAVHPDRHLELARSPGPLIVAGDGYGEAKVEGAVRSGWSAADAILAWLAG